MKKGFGSDNHSGIHPKLLNSIIQANVGHQPSYGTDDVSFEVFKIFKELFGSQTEAHFVYNGTAANVLSLRAGMNSYQAVLCTDVSHINTDEGAAPEFFAGKLMTVPSHNGKMIPSELEKFLIRKGDQHYSQPKMLSLTQPTELGTCYSISEMKELIQIAKTHGLFVHIDGARISNAASYLKKSFKEFTTDLGVDLVSFGGTKNGLAFGEAVVIINPALQKDFKYIRKQSAQLPSKTRFIACQFKEYFKDDLFKQIAQHSLSMAQLLEKELKAVISENPGSQIEINRPVESNGVFVKLPQKMIKPLREKYFFYVWDENTFECRLMTSWDTESSDIHGLISEIRKLLTKEL